MIIKQKQLKKNLKKIIIVAKDIAIIEKLQKMNLWPILHQLDDSEGS